MPQCWHGYSRSGPGRALENAVHSCMQYLMGAGQGSREASSQVARSHSVKQVCGRRQEVLLARV